MDSLKNIKYTITKNFYIIKMDTSSIDCNKDHIIKIKTYCFKCRKHTSSENLKKIDMDGKIQLKADCIECNGRKYWFVSKEGEDNIEIE